MSKKTTTVDVPMVAAVVMAAVMAEAAAAVGMAHQSTTIGGSNGNGNGWRQ